MILDKERGGIIEIHEFTNAAKKGNLFMSLLIYCFTISNTLPLINIVNSVNLD